MKHTTTHVRVYTKDLPTLASIERDMMKGQPKGTRFNDADVIGECIAAKLREIESEGAKR